MNEVKLTPAVILSIVQGMNAISNCDGQQHAERALLKAFYEECRQELESTSLPAFELVENHKFDAEMAKHAMPDLETKKLFLKFCIVCAYADGNYTSAERATVAEFARGLGVNEADLADIERTVSGHLANQIAHLAPTEALSAIVGELFQDVS